MKKVCIIGWPVAHSRSPLIHNYWIKKHGIKNALYEPLAVAPENLAETIGNLAALGYVGANVTVPHKEAVFKALSHCDPTASRLRAVNTLVTAGDYFEGRNTDGYGFMANLKAGAPDWRAASGPAVLLGAGGAARAIAAALDEAGAPEIRIVNRTRERAEQLIADLKLAHAKYMAPADAGVSMHGANLLVNTTSLGMKGTNEIDYALDRLPVAALVSDIVYTPLETGLLKQARARGNPAVDGLGMLLHQAVPGFEAWFGIRPEVTPELRALVLNDLGA
jgi:shikimate dehydrogenase